MRSPSLTSASTVAAIAPDGPRGLARSALAAVALVALSGPAWGAAFLVGNPEPDPPTGEQEPAPASAAEPARGLGIRWYLGPVAYRGLLSLDFRRTSGTEVARSSGGLLRSEIEFASYIWQPWFVRLSSSVGMILSRDQHQDLDGRTTSTTGLSAMGTVQAKVFPFSRFPIEVHAALSDSRATGDALLNDYRIVRLGINQSYRPPSGNDAYTYQLDYSRVKGSQTGVDHLIALNGNSQHRWDEHTVTTTLTASDNWADRDAPRSRLASVSAQHSFLPDSAFSADTLVIWNHNRLEFGGFGQRVSTGLQSLQLSSTMNWRPREDDWLYSANAPATVAGSVRLGHAQSSGSNAGRSQVFGLSAGISKQFSSELRAALSYSYFRSWNPGAPAVAQSGLGGSLAYTPRTVIALGEWRYTPSVSSSLNGTLVNSDRREVVSLQGSHGLNRTWQLDAGNSITFNVTQSVGTVYLPTSKERSDGLGHGMAGSWQMIGSTGAQSFLTLSVNDSRTRSETNGRGEFQFVNLQVSRRERLTRFIGWSADFTAQASRSSADQIDPFTGALRRQDDGWQRFYSGTLTFENARVFGIPRLRFSTLFFATTQQYERRELGDINAPLERTTESLETRLDYLIGQLESRLSARVAKVDGRRVNSLSARIQRRF